MVMVIIAGIFTYVDNAVEANLLALFTTNNDAVNQVYNVACGGAYHLKRVVVGNQSNYGSWFWKPSMDQEEMGILHIAWQTLARAKPCWDIQRLLKLMRWIERALIGIKIKTKYRMQPKIAVIGLGYVGTALAVEFAKSMKLLALTSIKVV